MPWVRQKLRGKAPPEVCRWLLRLVGGHEVATVVIAAEQALLQLLAENSKVRGGERSQYIVCPSLPVACRLGRKGGTRSTYCSLFAAGGDRTCCVSVAPFQPRPLLFLLRMLDLIRGCLRSGERGTAW